ncbi:hypothetical protein [Candidatus Spongiisocius sp.]|uniref:hypothetical protein n=1 Tax=Candidatus Spongiisocius sp. TaxID=3101273 RepID=UPI003B5CF58C
MSDEPDFARLYRWLIAVRPPDETYGSPDWRPVRQWLDARGNIVNRLFMEAIREDPDAGVPGRHFEFEWLTHGCRLPADFGRWCLGQALAVAPTEPELAAVLVDEVSFSLDQPSISIGLEPDAIRDRLVEQPDLLRRFDDLAKQRSRTRSYQRDPRVEHKISQYAEKQRKQQQEWDQHLRAHRSELADNRLPLNNLDVLAQVYLGLVSGLGASTPTDRVAKFIGGDPELVEMVTSALERAIWRDDLPSVSQTISWHSQTRRPYLAWPVAVSLTRLGGDSEGLGRVDADRRRRALALAFTSPMIPGASESSYLSHWLKDDPDLVFEVLTRCAIAGIRNGDSVIPGLYHLGGIKDHKGRVFQARRTVLEAFPTRIPAKQLAAFDHLLALAITSGTRDALEPLASRKLSLRSLDVAQRVRWMTVAAMLSGGGEAARGLERYARENERRVRHLAGLLEAVEDVSGVGTQLGAGWDSEMLTGLINLLGRSYGPLVDDLDTSEVHPSFLISSWISMLGARPDPAAKEGLERLEREALLEKWRRHLVRARETQRVVAGNASYQHADPDQVQQTLNNLEPANPADLWALLTDLLSDIAGFVRGDSSNLWRAFWNEDSYGRPVKPKPENSCRDVLLREINNRLPTGVDAVPEGRYASDKRADIRVAYRGFNVPIEIKKDTNRDLLTAVAGQLRLYTTDPTTSGYGIYLVLRFCYDRQGRLPTRPLRTDAELHRILEGQLPDDDRHRIAVKVMNVTKPG